MSNALVYRASYVLRGDGEAIRRIARDPKATDQAVAVVFFAVLLGTTPLAIGDPYRWMLVSFGAATIGLAAYAVSVWLVGKAFEGAANLVPLFRASGFAAAPLVLGLLPGFGLPIGAICAFVVASRVVTTLHVDEQATAMIATVLPALIFASTVVLLAN